MSNSNQLRDPNPVPPDSTAVTRGSSVQSPRKFGRLLKKVKDGVTKKNSVEIIQKRSNMENLRSREPLLPDVDHEDALSTLNIEPEVQNTPSDVKQGGDPQSALRDAQGVVGRMTLLSGPVESGASAAQNASGDLDTYLQPLRIFDNVIGNIADVHPYAKMALGILSCAFKMVIAESDCDQAVHRLVYKLAEVYDFMIQDETLS
ncbi:uncharacterized protein F5147DRAFT_656018 [Suillus discolor]|uniref:Uncharacterized protein n=1 Tax=Suillus discolor TaxID=1912936 RepID=A0A9P7F0D8_9AGAM|nr:uncharacterized protein F5147DRAFT_656018 [Suillus discolor]KAG2098742.1 hypothetical protein F5147DRAFT_656018 [Suillus discolor]